MAQIIVRLKERELKTVPVTCVATRIGRDVSNDVVIDNDGVSRHHATLRYEASVGAFLIYDQSSSNGMFFRGAPSKAARLDDGDEVQIGKFTLVFQEAGGAPVDALTPEPPRQPDATPLPVVNNPLPTMALPAAKLKPKPRAAPAISPSTPPPAPAPTSARSAAPSDAPPAATPAPAGAPTGEIVAQTRTLRLMMWLLVVLVVLLVALLGMLVMQR
ncbi:MAG: FHA domain-containing protein [Polyangiales bacterium]